MTSSTPTNPKADTGTIATPAASAQGFLRTVGWGFIPLPGERRRLQRLETHARAILQIAKLTSDAEDPVVGAAAAADIDEDTSDLHQVAAQLSRNIPHRLGQRKLVLSPNNPMRGEDVVELQTCLRAFGYTDLLHVDGIFGPETARVVKRFQNDYGIRNDGVCGKVTMLVVNHLQDLGISSDRPVSRSELRTIQWSVAAQSGGFILVDPVYVGRNDSFEVDDILTVVRNQVERRIEEYVRVPTLHPQGAPEGDEVGLSPRERAIFANSVRAELVISLDLRRDPASGDGVASFCSGEEDSEADISRALAVYIQQELVGATGVIDRGVQTEQSELFALADAPSVRVEIGNIQSSTDRARLLKNPNYPDMLARGIAAGIRRLYLLGAREAPIGDNAINEFSRPASQP